MLKLRRRGGLAWVWAYFSFLDLDISTQGHRRFRLITLVHSTGGVIQQLGRKARKISRESQDSVVTRRCSKWLLRDILTSGDSCDLWPVVWPSCLRYRLLLGSVLHIFSFTGLLGFTGAVGGGVYVGSNYCLEGVRGSSVPWVCNVNVHV